MNISDAKVFLPKNPSSLEQQYHLSKEQRKTFLLNLPELSDTFKIINTNTSAQSMKNELENLAFPL